MWGTDLERRRGRQECLGVGVTRRAEDLVGRALLEDRAEIHHHHPVGQASHRSEVVGDQQVAQAALALDPRQQVEHGAADRHVERRGRLVQDEDRRLDRERAGDGDALTLTTAEAAGVAVHELRGETYLLEEPAHPGPSLGAVQVRVQAERLRHGVASGHPWIQRGQRVLEDHLDFAVRLPQRPLRKGGQLDVAERDRASGGLGEAGDAACQRRLARAALADDGEGLPRPDGEVDTVERRDTAVCLRQAGDRQDGWFLLRHGRSPLRERR